MNINLINKIDDDSAAAEEIFPEPGEHGMLGLGDIVFELALEVAPEHLGFVECVPDGFFEVEIFPVVFLFTFLTEVKRQIIKLFFLLKFNLGPSGALPEEFARPELISKLLFFASLFFGALCLFERFR